MIMLACLHMSTCWSRRLSIPSSAASCSRPENSAKRDRIQPLLHRPILQSLPAVTSRRAGYSLAAVNQQNICLAAVNSWSIYGAQWKSCSYLALLILITSPTGSQRTGRSRVTCSSTTEAVMKSAWLHHIHHRSEGKNSVLDCGMLRQVGSPTRWQLDGAVGCARDEESGPWDLNCAVGTLRTPSHMPQCPSSVKGASGFQGNLIYKVSPKVSSITADA